MRNLLFEKPQVRNALHRLKNNGNFSTLRRREDEMLRAFNIYADPSARLCELLHYKIIAS